MVVAARFDRRLSIMVRPTTDPSPEAAVMQEPQKKNDAVVFVLLL
jgi:hypothetical protein